MARGFYFDDQCWICSFITLFRTFNVFFVRAPLISTVHSSIYFSGRSHFLRRADKSYSNGNTRKETEKLKSSLSSEEQYMRSTQSSYFTIEGIDWTCISGTFVSFSVAISTWSLPFIAICDGIQIKVVDMMTKLRKWRQKRTRSISGWIMKG